jgi:hypothetical protein
VPDDRFIHPRLGHSTKVCMLTDLEFRVWTQYLLSADDGGVMRSSALTIQADNDALAKRSQRQIHHALDHMVTIGLLLEFEHQGRKYVCDPNWQEFQKVQWPRPTGNPQPPQAVLAKCAEETRVLLERILKRSQEGSRKTHRLEAKGLRLEATTNGNGLDERFERFWKEYPKKVGKDAARREWQILAPDNDFTDRILVALQQQRASAQWLKDAGQFIPHPRTWLHQGRWQDEATPAAEHVSQQTTMLASATKGFLGDDD